MNTEDEQKNLPTSLSGFIRKTGSNPSLSTSSNQRKSAPTSLSGFLGKEPAIQPQKTVSPTVAQTTPTVLSPKPKDDSLLKTTQLGIGQGLVTGGAIALKRLNEYSNWFYKKFNKGKDLFGRDSEEETRVLDEDVKVFEKKVTEGVRETIGDERMNSYLFQASSGIGQGIGQLASFAVSPVAGFTVLAGQTIGAGKEAYDNAYEGMINNGASEEEAKRIANINGNIVGTVTSLEALPLFRFMKLGKLLTKPLSKSTKEVVQRIAGNALLESSTESLQQAVESETARQTWNKEAGFNDTLRDTISSFLVSIPTGILFGGAGEMQLRQNHLDKAEKQIDELLEAETDLEPEQRKVMAEFIVDNYAITATQDLFSEEERRGIEEFAKRERVIQEQQAQQVKEQEEPAFQRKANEPSVEELVENGEILAVDTRIDNGTSIYEVDIDTFDVPETVNQEEVARIQAEIRNDNMPEPVQVGVVDGKPQVISGYETIQAMKNEGMSFIDIVEAPVVAQTSPGTTKAQDVTVDTTQQKPVAIGQVKVNSVDQKTKQEIIDVVDYLRLKEVPEGRTEKTVEDDISRLSQLFGINQDQSSAVIANQLTKILEQAPEGELDVDNPDVPVFQRKELSSKLIEDLQGRDTVKKSYIEQRIVSGDINLKQQYQATPFTDDLGVTWNKVEVKPEYADTPVMAFQRESEAKTVSYETGVQTLKEAQKRLGIQFPIAVYERILTGEVLKDGSLGEAYGMYLDGTITLSEFVKETTAQHELGHLIFRNLEQIPLFKNVSREQLYTELRNHKKEWSKLSKYDLEEKLMELVEQYSRDIDSGKVKKPKTGLQKIVQDIYNAIKEMLGISKAEYSSIQRFLDTMYFGKSNQVVTLYNSNKTSDFMQARFQEFGKDINELDADSPVFQKKASLSEVEQAYRIANQKTTQGRKTKQQIKQELFPGKDKLTITEQAQIKKRLKEQEKGFKKGFGTGKKLGTALEREKQTKKIVALTRKQEIKQFNDRIMRRLYKKTLFEELRRLPRSEWGQFTTQIANVDVSESKYLNTLSKITNKIAELEVAEGERKVLALSRRDIGFLRHLYDINQPLVTDIKETLNIRDTYKRGERAGQYKDELKHIKDYTLEELNMFKAELKRRIEYRQKNPVRYFDNVELKEETTSELVGGVLRSAIDTVERTLRNISPAIEERMNTYYFDVNRAKKDRMKKVEPFIKWYTDTSKDTQAQVKKAALNGDTGKLEALIQSSSDQNPEALLKDVREVMDDLYNDLKSVGLDVNYLKNYFPRALKPISEDRANILIAQFEQKLGRKATTEERLSLITNLTRGFNFIQNPFVTLSGKKFEAERLIEHVDDTNIDMYEDPVTAVIHYIAGATNVVEQRRLFGKNIVEGIDHDTFIKNSLTKLVHDYYEQGVIKQKDITQLQRTLNTLFVNQTGQLDFKEWFVIQAIRNFTSNYLYPLTLGQITSTMNQVKDLSMQVLMNDIFVGQWNTFRSFGVTPESIGLDDSIMKLEGLSQNQKKNKVTKFLEKSMTPFAKTDKFFLRIGINSIYQRLVKTAKKSNNEKFVNQLDLIFKDRASKVLSELQDSTGNEKDISVDVQRLIWGEIARIRPISDLQKTEYAKKAPAFYVLRSFMIKQLEFVRSEGLDYIASGYKQKDGKLIAKGIGRLATLMTVIGVFGAGVDEAKDWVLGSSKRESFKDRLLDNILNIVGLNNYMITMGQQTGYVTQFIYSYIPAGASVSAQIVDDLVRDIKAISEGKAYKVRSYRRFPLIGNIIYKRFGGGNK